MRLSSFHEAFRKAARQSQSDEDGRKRHAEAIAEGKRRAAELAKRKRRHRMRLAKAGLADGYSLERPK